MFFVLQILLFQGKGSIKDGKMGLVKYGPLPGEDEPLHAYITGTSPEIVAKAVEKVRFIEQSYIILFIDFLVSH